MLGVRSYDFKSRLGSFFDLIKKWLNSSLYVMVIVSFLNE